MKESKTAGLSSGRSLDARMPRLKSESGCDAIENLGCCLLLLAAALFLLRGSRQVGDGEVGFLLIALLGLLRLLLRGSSRQVGYAEVGLLCLLLLLGLLFRGGGQLIALYDAADWGCRVRWQADVGEKAKRDSNSSDLAHVFVL